jgi:hypothetical protein
MPLEQTISEAVSKAYDIAAAPHSAPTMEHAGP